MALPELLRQLSHSPKIGRKRPSLLLSGQRQGQRQAEAAWFGVAA